MVARGLVDSFTRDSTLAYMRLITHIDFYVMKIKVLSRAVTQPMHEATAPRRRREWTNEEIEALKEV
eukprot:502566-Amorphochlora_amoeboformis.AAC.1